jgi:hypothetical protein
MSVSLAMRNSSKAALRQQAAIGYPDDLRYVGNNLPA